MSTIVITANPFNEDLFRATMKKADSYSETEQGAQYRRQAYERTANNVANLVVDAFLMPPNRQKTLGVGPKTNAFIYDQLLAKEKYLLANIRCLNKHNTFLLDALLEKANSYPADQPWRKRAYLQAAYLIATMCAPVLELPTSQLHRLGVGVQTNRFIYQVLSESYPLPKRKNTYRQTPY
jgi:hypothetical protein